MKKLFFATAVFVLFSVTVANAEITGEVLYTDIDTYIDKEPIPCYVADGYVVLKAEDLTHYGFDIDYNDADRVLTITKNAENTETTPIYYDENGGVLAGTKYSDIYSSDIKTVYNGEEITSYNIAGITLIRPEDMDIKSKFYSRVRCLYISNDGRNIPYIGDAERSLTKGWQRYYIEDRKNIFKENLYTGEKTLLAELPGEIYEKYYSYLREFTADWLNVERDIEIYADTYGETTANRRFTVNRFSGEATETYYHESSQGRH